MTGTIRLPGARTFTRILPCALITAALCACGSTVRMPDLHTPLPAHWRNEPSALKAAPPDLHDWWHAFGDPRLDAVVDTSLHSNLDVAQAVERLRAERALYAHADAPFMPSLHLRTDDPIDPDASASYFTMGFDAQWELGLFGRRAAAERAARGKLAEAEADLRQARVTLVAEVVRNWIDLRAAERSVQVLERIRDARRHSLKWIDVRVKLRLAAPADRARAEAALAQAEAALAGPRQDADAAAQRLALLLGRAEPDSDWLKPGTLPDLGDRDLTSAPANLLRTRPGIARAEAEVLQAAADLGIARAQMYPNIGIGGTVVWSTSTLTHKEPEFNYIGAIGPVIDIPLIDWGLRQARAHARGHQLKASVLAYRKAVLAGVADVETALGNLSRQRARETSSRTAVKAMDQVAGQQATRQRLGLDSKLELEQSAIARDQAQLDLIDARAARDIAYVALFKALGGAPDPQASGQSAGKAR